MRALTTALLTLALLAIGPAALATAAPNLAIEQPLAGSATNNTLPPFSGSSEDELDLVTVKVYAGPSAEGSPVATLVTTLPPFEGKWEVATEAPLEPGVYTAVAEQETQETESAISAPVTFTIDTTAPAVSIDPASSPTNDATPTLTGGDGTEAGDTGVTVTIYKGPAPEGETASTGEASTEGSAWGYTPNELPDGTYTAQATQHDEAGNTATSTPVTFTVDTTAPAVSIDPAASPTKDATPTLTGSAGTEAGDTAVAVTIYKGPAAEGEVASNGEATSEGTAWKYTPTQLPDGTYTAQATQHDEAGNTATSTPVTFTIDTNPPNVTIDPTSSPTKDATPTLTGAAGTEAGDGTVTVTIYEGPVTKGEIKGKVESTGEASSEGSGWEYTPAGLPDGTYTAQATQHDEAGNTATSTPVTFTIDTNPPAVSIDPAASPTKDATPTLTGAAGAEAGDSTVTVTIYEGPTTEGETASTGEASTVGTAWKYTPTQLPDGTYTAQATQHDEAGNTATSTAVTFTIDTTPPAVTIKPASSLTNDATPTLTGDAGTETSDSAVAVTIYKGSSAGGAIASTGAATTKGSTWSYTSTHLANGTYTARATQQDEAGNIRTSLAVTFTVDATAPAPTITTPAEGALLNVSKTTLSGLTGQSSGDLQAVRLKFYFGASSTPFKTLALNASAGKWTTGASSPTLGNGIYTVIAEQADEAENIGTSTVSFTISTGSPSVTLDTSAFVDRASSLYADATPSFSGSGSTAPEDSSTILVKIYKGEATSGSPVREMESALSGSKWKTSPVTALPDDTYTALAEQATSSSNPTGLSAPVTFTVDGHAPGVTLTTPADASTTSSSSQPLAGAAGTAAGDSATVTIHLYAGTSAAGSPLQAVLVQASAGAWTAAFGGLEPGTYTARAEQRDDVGNIGLSAPATFTVTTPEPPPVTPPVTPPVVPPVTTPVTPPVAPPSTPPATPPPAATAPALMQPFPVVRIAGSVSSSGVKLNLLTVQAPIGSIVTVTCRGHGCPAKRVDTVSTSGRSKSKLGLVTIVFRRFERSLRAGASLQIRISKAGQIGKYTRFTIRRGKLPRRIDSCLSPAGVQPIACPS
ncbi:MAG TPA: Ig-like domain-containing protein [Solirubrobacteraceae bacterium]|nr:Ig-like domain-containing protein [Solirubrobacteraceae bacterium]